MARISSIEDWEALHGEVDNRLASSKIAKFIPHFKRIVSSMLTINEATIPKSHNRHLPI